MTLQERLPLWLLLTVADQWRIEQKKKKKINKAGFEQLSAYHLHLL